MNIFIVTDMEGVSGVVTNDQASGTGHPNSEARKWLTCHVNAAVKAAFEMGADKVLVNDGHNRGQNLILDLIHERVHVVTGRASRRLGVMEGIDKGFDAALMIGLHGMEGTSGVLPHTVHGIISRLLINGREAGEIELNALTAGHYNVPVAMVSGDEAACTEAKSIMPDVETAAVMKGIGMYSAVIPAPSAACEIIYKSAKKALARLDHMNAYKLNGQAGICVSFKSVSAADGAAMVPGTRRIDNLSCGYSAKDIVEAQMALNCMIVMAANNN